MRKKGRPKKNSRKKSALEVALAESRGEKNVRKRVVASEEELINPSASNGDCVNGLMGAV